MDSPLAMSVVVGACPAGRRRRLGKLTLALERTTASKCPVTFKVYGTRAHRDAGPVTYEEVFATLPAGFAVDVWEVTGAALKSVLAYPNAQGWVLTPSSSLRYTLATYLVKNSPVSAPAGDRVTIR
ncbi:5'-nucleotidase C-terminal domain-containing protein [Microbispora sp. NBC_01189]|uniref:5'-nucleotidase C-terminal domain-containing protein n=1 Tax=Microbispora sp. NBC_01189 TaxID=2903583 RepID=UPI002E0E377A|nr:5'-nucleotidase C-terminal domain-containing protein [Microbispora sp. NBC_01189]